MPRVGAERSTAHREFYGWEPHGEKGFRRCAVERRGPVGAIFGGVTLLPVLPDPDTATPCVRDPDLYVGIESQAQAARAARGCARCPLLDACRRYAAAAPPWALPVVLAGELHGRDGCVPLPRRGRRPREGGLFGRIFCVNPLAHDEPVAMRRNGVGYKCPHVGCYKGIKGVEQVLPATWPERVYVTPAKGMGYRTLDQLRERVSWDA